MRLIQGVLGWGNPGCRSKSQFDTYGPGGRWDGNDRNGDLLADALARQGDTEGAVLFVVSVSRADVTADRHLLHKLDQALRVLIQKYGATTEGGYALPSEVTTLRIYAEDGEWWIDGADEAGRYTEACWTFDTEAEVRAAAPEFVRLHGLPGGVLL